MAVAERVADERADALGKSVGYQIRLEKMQVSMSLTWEGHTINVILRRMHRQLILPP